jgi:hypothetical protein
MMKGVRTKLRKKDVNGDYVNTVFEPHNIVDLKKNTAYIVQR